MTIKKTTTTTSKSSAISNETKALNGVSGLGIVGTVDQAIQKAMEDYDRTARARGFCKNLGITDPWALNDCIRTKSAPASPSEPAAGDEPQIDYYSLVSQALGSASVKGAGLGVQPPGGTAISHVKVIAYVTRTTQSETINVGGESIGVTFTAIRFSVSWGDGSAPTVTSAAPSRYPHDHVWHRYKPGSYAVTLTTEWEATWVHPENGELVTETSTMTTTETSAPFQVVEAGPVLLTGKKNK